MEPNLNNRASAEDWLKMSESKWRLQTLQSRGRYNPATGEYRRLPTRVRRFLNGTPVGLVSEVIGILGGTKEISGRVFNCEEAADAVYRATNTYIRKDGAELAANTKDATYTVVQDLLLVTEGGDSADVPDGSSCSQVSSSEYRWDEPYVADCPDGGQGVAYQIANVTRDRETDLFSYQIRKVTAVTQESGPETVRCSGRSVTTVRSWDNLYGSPGDFRYDSAVHSGGPVAIPSACGQPDGTTVEVSVQQNPDCTYKVTVQTTEALTDDGTASFYRDLYKLSETHRWLNAPAPFTEGVEQSGGLTVRLSSEKNEDGTYTNTREEETERPVPSSTVERRIGPRGTVVSRTDTNQTSPAAGIASEYGSFKSTKTPGGLYTNEYTEYVRSVVDRLGSLCTDTALLHTDETTGSAASVGTGHTYASGGVVTTVSYDTDAEGLVTRRTRVQTEHTVQGYSQERATTVLGTSVRTVSRSVGSAAASAALNASAVGRTVRAEMTDGRLWNLDVTEFTKTAGVTLGTECEKTVFSHVHETSQSVAAVGSEAADAGGGFTRRTSFRVDSQTGGVTKTDRYTRELQVTGSRTERRVTARGTSVTVTDTNVASATHAASAPGDVQVVERTPGGLVNETYTRVTARTGNLADECEKTLFRETDTSVKTSGTKEGAHPARPAGSTVSRRQEQGDDGLWRIEDIEVKEASVPVSGKSVAVGRRGKRTVTTNTQVGSPTQEPSARDYGRAVDWERTPGGNYTERVTVFEPAAGEIGKSSEKTIFEERKSETTVTDTEPAEASSASGGVTHSVSGTLTDEGVWERTEAETTELEVDVQRSEEYEDALEKSDVHTVTNSQSDTVDGGKRVSAGKNGTATGRYIQQIGRQKTPGGRTNVRVTKQEAKKWCSKLIKLNTRCGNDHTEYFWQGYVFRNHTEDEVDSLIKKIEDIIVYSYWGDPGSYRMSPNISVTPNKFGLLDGSVSISFNFTPQGYAVGRGKKPNDDPYEVEYDVESHDVQPLSKPAKSGSAVTGDAYVVIRKETHVMGAGTGFSNFEKKLKAGAKIKGSQFNYNPAGDTFAYDFIKKVVISTKAISLGSSTAFPS